jgi:glycosyltransferase involved in cell wall biosynthesis
MARILIIALGFPDDLSSGRHLRVHHLCRELAREHELFLVDVSGSDSSGAPRDIAPFAAVETLAAPPAGARSWRRHFRPDNASLLRLSHPAYYRGTLARVRALADRWRAECVISCAPGANEIAAALDLPRLLDRPDCVTLTTERILANPGRKLSFAGRLALRVDLPRQRAGERNFVRAFDYTLTISRSDRDRLLEVSGVSPERVVLVPNGVAPEALAAWRDRPERTRRVVFWGNLDFPPNWTAVAYFHEQVFLPLLAPQGIEWEILGRNANAAIRAMAEHPLIRLTGFKEDLFDYVADAGVMVNPMVEGSGLKNKVLEAFAIGLPVVSTELGVDALPLDAGTECLVANEPRAFADAVLRLLDDAQLYDRMRRTARARVERDYQWAGVGRSVSKLVDRVLAERATR